MNTTTQPESTLVAEAAGQSTNAGVDARRMAAMPRGVGIGLPIYAERALNAEIWDVEGKRDQHGIVLIADEIQTGFGRTGKMFAMQHHDALPDLMLAKSLAGGVPLSAVCGRAEIMDAPAPGGLGGTYAANALAIASAHAVFDVIEEERLVERAQRLGQALKSRLEALRARCTAIFDVRSLGSMVAMEFKTADGKPDANFTRLVHQRAQDAGLLLLICGVYGSVIRFLFPLTIEDSVFEEGLAILAKAVQA